MSESNNVEPMPSNTNAASDGADQARSEATDFDISKLRLPQDFAANAGVKKAILTVPVRKPDRQWFVRVHPDPAYQLEALVLELKDDREIYFVHPTLGHDLSGEVVHVVLFTAITRQGDPFLWPVRLPAKDGRQLEWHRSAAEAAKMAMKKWIRVQANMGLQAYEVSVATGNLPEPEWPKKTLQELLEIAFKDHLIKTLNHVVLKQLRGDI